MFKLQDAYQCGSAGKTVKTRRQCTVTLSKLWWKPLPNVRVCRLIGIVTRSRLWLNITPKIKLYKLLGKVTRWVPVPCFAWPMFVPILSGSIPKFFKSSSSSVRKLFFARKKITCPDSMFIMFIIPVFPRFPRAIHNDGCLRSGGQTPCAQPKRSSKGRGYIYGLTWFDHGMGI